ncbi:MAG: hypothetical protein QG581_397, partial [Patescibacteria group bacterium]|nr:hypothetical protein [Patescibacteria group bacterium]
YRIFDRTASALHGVLIEVIRNRCFEKGIKPQGYPSRCDGESAQLSPEEIDIDVRKARIYVYEKLLCLEGFLLFGIPPAVFS